MIPHLRVRLPLVFLMILPALTGACAGQLPPTHSLEPPVVTPVLVDEIPSTEVVESPGSIQKETSPNRVEMADIPDPVQTANPVVGELNGQLEIFNLDRDEPYSAVLEALNQSFLRRYPGIQISQTSESLDPGSNPGAVLVSRLQDGYPPDAFQALGGRDLIDRWVAVGALAPVTSIIDDGGGQNNLPQGLIDLLSDGGDFWSIPLGVHRSNVLWYNKNVFAKNHLNPPSNFSHFFDVAESLQEEGIIPLALGDNSIWGATHLLENVLLGKLGGDAYRGLWTGDTDWSSPEITAALDTYVKMLDFTNIDHAALTWDQAAQLVAEGDAAMTIMGDWADVYFGSAGLQPKIDYGWIPSPGTEGDFLILIDVFALPAGAVHPEQGHAWLDFATSLEGQNTFNLQNGSIPARLDADPSLYGVYQQSAISDFAGNEISPSLVHGAAAPQAWIDAINDIMTLFIVDRDVEAAQQRFARVCSGMGICS